MQMVSDSFRLRELEEKKKAGKLLRGRPGIRSRIRGIERKIAFVKEQARKLDLRSTMQGAMRFERNLKNASSEQVDKDVDSLFERFQDEIVDLVFFYLPADKQEYYQRTEIFGDAFKVNFPTANMEIIEAANCFAFGRNTACVFHLMRAAEVVLKALFIALGLPALTSARERNWNGILQQIRAALDADRSRKDFDFFDSAYAFLAAAKNPVRNATMHVDANYDEDGARIVFDGMGAFMRHIATKLNETP